MSIALRCGLFLCVVGLVVSDRHFSHREKKTLARWWNVVLNGSTKMNSTIIMWFLLEQQNSAYMITRCMYLWWIVCALSMKITIHEKFNVLSSLCFTSFIHHGSRVLMFFSLFVEDIHQTLGFKTDSAAKRYYKISGYCESHVEKKQIFLLVERKWLLV